MTSGDDIERRLWNWVRWRAGGGGDGRFVQVGGSGLVSSVYRDGPRIRRSGYAVATYPVLVSEAQATDRAIRGLPTELAQALHCWYLRRALDGFYFTADWTQAEMAARIGWNVRTFQREIERARERLRTSLTRS